MTSFSESEVKQIALDWLAGLGWSVAHGPDIAPGALQKSAERDGYDQVVLEQRLADAIDRLNADLPQPRLPQMLVKRWYPYNVGYGTTGSIHDKPGR